MGLHIVNIFSKSIVDTSQGKIILIMKGKKEKFDLNREKGRNIIVGVEIRA